MNVTLIVSGEQIGHERDLVRLLIKKLNTLD